MIESDDDDFSDLELTAEELAEAEKALQAKSSDKSKSTDIVIELDASSANVKV